MPLLADVYLDNFEQYQIMRNLSVLYWSRHVDDVFCFWRGRDEELQDFVTSVNNMHPK